MSTAKTKKEAKEIVKEVPKKAHVLAGNSISLKGRYINEHHIFLPKGVKITDLRPESFAHIANRVEDMSTIAVTAVDNAFYGQLKVLSVGEGTVHFDITFVKTPEPVGDVKDTDVKFKAEFINVQDKFGVTRLSDGMRMIKDLGSKNEANVWIANEMKNIR